MAKKNDKKKSEKVRDLLFQFDSVFAQFETIVEGEHALKNAIDMGKVQDTYQTFFGAVRILEALEAKADA